MAGELSDEQFEWLLERQWNGWGFPTYGYRLTSRQAHILYQRAMDFMVTANQDTRMKILHWLDHHVDTRVMM